MVLQFGPYAKKKKIGSIEYKLLFTFFYFVIFGVTSMVFVADVEAKVENFINATKQYINCEAMGATNKSCDQFVDDIDRDGFFTLGAVTYILIGLLPVVILTFIIDWSATGKIFKKVMLCRKRHSSVNQTSGVFSTFSPAPSTSVSNQ